MVKEQIPEKVFENLYIERNVANVVHYLYENFDVPEKYVKKAISFYSKDDQIETAIEIAKESGLIDITKKLIKKAIKHSENCGYIDDIVLESAKEFEIVYDKEKIHDAHIKSQKSRMEYYEKRGYYLNAARIAKDLGMNDKSNELYEKALERDIKNMNTHTIPDILKEYKISDERKKDIQEVCLNYIKEGGYYHQYNDLKELGMDVEAKEIERKWNLQQFEGHKKRKEYYEAAHCANKVGLKDEAKELFIKVIKNHEKYCQYDKAAEVAKEAGLKNKARNYKKLDKLIKKNRKIEK